MSGICGLYDRSKKNHSFSNSLNQMARALMHSSPDLPECYYQSEFAVAYVGKNMYGEHHSSNILFNEDKSILMAANGDVFNNGELVKLLKNKHAFRTQKPFESVIHLYEEMHTSCFEKINGQFSIILIDFNKDEVYCIRDHFGCMPLFYTTVNNIFIFGSEIKSILAYPGVNRVVDLYGMDQIMTFPGLVSPRTMFENIHSIKSAHYLYIPRSGSEKQIEYWDLPFVERKQRYPLRSDNEYIEELSYLFQEAVNRRVDINETGLFLSGGLDSALVAGYLNQVDNNKKWSAFSVYFDDIKITEKKYQEETAIYLGLHHKKKLLSIQEIVSCMENAVYYSENPLKESYNTANYELARMAENDNVDIILTGQGADEIFGGYIGYRFNKADTINHKSDSFKHQEEAIREQLWGDKDFIYEKNYFSYDITKRQLYSSLTNDKLGHLGCLSEPLINIQKIKQVDRFIKRSYIDFKLRLADHLLSEHGTRIINAHGIKSRHPFLDLNIVNFAACLPLHLKLNGMIEKYILKVLASQILPQSITERSKFAFVAPGSPQLYENKQEYLQDILSYSKIKREGYFNPDTVERLKKNFFSNKTVFNPPYDNDYLLFIITFEIFLQQFNMPSLK